MVKWMDDDLKFIFVGVHAPALHMLNTPPFVLYLRATILQAKIAYSASLYSSVCEQYNVLKSAIHDKQGLQGSTRSISLSQPWQ